MKNFFAGIAAAMRAFGSFSMVMVRKGGRWVAELVRVPGAPAAPMAAAPVPRVEVPEDYSAIKRLAGLMIRGLDPSAADLRAVPERTVRWLAAIGRDGLAKVCVADDQVLRGHIRNSTPIRGLVPHDPAAVADLMRARQAPAAVAKRQQTRRDILEAAGHMIPA